MIDELTDYYKNPRSLSDKEFKQLKASLDKFGMIDKPIVNADSANTIIGGHQRKHVLESTGAKEIECWIPDRVLSDKEVEELNIRLNKNTGSWDFDTLANEFQLDDLLEWGFDKGELDLDLWADDAPEDVEPQIDKAEELRVKWGVETGQLWQLGEHRLICGDCTKDDFIDEHILITDPPYGIDAAEMTMGSHQSSLPKDARLSNVENWDTNAVDVIPFVNAAKYSCIWGAQYLALSLPVSNDWLCWDKKNPNLSFSEFELAWTNFDTRCRILSHHWGNEKKQHITQKPLPVIEWALSLCPDKTLPVYDPFLGSGTTLIACERLNRKCRAVEIGPAYVAVAIQRWVDVTGGEPVMLSN